MERKDFCLSDYYLITPKQHNSFLGVAFIAKSSILLPALKKLTLKYKQIMIIWSPENICLKTVFSEDYILMPVITLGAMPKMR